jgi:Ca2+-binding RTX toxin-like protein
MPTGTSSAETLSGTAGSDSFTGLGGNDIFIFSGEGEDVITDFRSRYFTAALDGPQEVPSNLLVTASGAGSVVLNGAHTSAAVTLSSTGLTGNATLAHIHRGAVGADGPAIFDLSPPAVTSFSLDRTLSGASFAAEIDNLISGNLYFNTHTAMFGGGEIRGQILAVAGDTGADQIDLTTLNIGGFETLQLITADDATGSAKITVTSNGVSSSMTLAGLALADLTAADFVFAGATADTRTGTANADDLFGAGGNDTLKGLAGIDRLFGELGKDKLDGGIGADRLIGGLGKDTMTGGAGKDVFDINSAADSGKKSSTRDVITDFKHKQDKIDLKDIDANTKKPSDQAFKFVGDATFHKLAGELHFVQIDSAGTAADKTIVEGDVNGDGKVDFQIELKGLISLTKGDFVL